MRAAGFLPVLFVIFFSLGICTGTLLAARPHVFFGPPMGDEPDLEHHLVTFIDGAEKTLEACFFDVKNEAIVDAFVRAAERGVELRFVTDDDRYFHREKGKRVENELRPQIQRLVDAGVEVKHDDRSPLMHNKFCIKDDKYLWTGSFNITRPGNEYNVNNAMWVESLQLCAIYNLEFTEMFDEGQFGPRSISMVEDQKATIDGQLYEVYFAPEDDPNARILELVENATHEIYWMTYAFTADTIGDELVNKKIEGLKVEGIFDHLLYRSTGPHCEYNKLTAADIPVKVLRPYKGILHNKVFIIDPNTDHGIVVMGSLNISASGGNANDENTIIIHDSEVARLYYEEYLRRKGQCSEDVTASVAYADVPVVKGKLDKLQIHLATNSVRVEDIQIEFPARWKLKRESFTSAKLFRGTAEVTTEVHADFKSQKLTLEGVCLTAIGNNKHLLIELTDIDAPKIAGIYTVTVRTRKTKDAKFIPLAIHPTIQVYKEEKEAKIDDRLEALDQLLNNLMALDVMASSVETQKAILKDYQTQFNGLEPLILGDTMKGDYSRLIKLVDYADDAKNQQSLIYRAMIEKLANAYKVVANQSIHQNDLSASKLAKRIKRLVRAYEKKFSVDVDERT